MAENEKKANEVISICNYCGMPYKAEYPIVCSCNKKKLSDYPDYPAYPYDPTYSSNHYHIS